VSVGTAGFASLSTGLYNLGVGSAKGGPLHGRHVADAAYVYYLWHLADTVPLLKVPDTLNWELKHPFTDSIHGSLAVVYSVLVVLPLIYGATKVIVRVTGDSSKRSSSE
jgi:hypothetical protein